MPVIERSRNERQTKNNAWLRNNGASATLSNREDATDRLQKQAHLTQPVIERSRNERQTKNKAWLKTTVLRLRLVGEPVEPQQPTAV